MKNSEKLKAMIEYLLSLTYKDLHFTQRIHPTNDGVGNNLFRFSGLDFRWIKAGEWSKHEHNREPLKYESINKSTGIR